MSARLVKLASAGMPPKQAQAPKATITLDLSRSSLAISSCSVLRIAPLKRHRSMLLSSMARTWWYLKSRAIGQNTISTRLAISSIFSFVSRTATSQPPQAAAQYNASFGLAIGATSVPAERSQFPDLFRHFVNDSRKAVSLRRGDPVQAQPVLFDAELGQHFLEQGYPAGCFHITFQVMTFAGMSAADENAIGPFLESLEDKGGVHPAGAHDPDDADIGSVFLP